MYTEKYQVTRGRCLHDQSTQFQGYNIPYQIHTFFKPSELGTDAAVTVNIKGEIHTGSKTTRREDG